MDGDLLGKSNEPQFMSFQDFSPINRSGGAGQAQLDVSSPDHQQNFGNLGGDSTGIDMIQDLQSMPGIKDDADVPRSFWTIEYYQKYFNVDTNDVVQRIKRSMIPHGADNYLLSHIRPNPDLYGPFWVCVTLVFSIAISGNLANYLQTANSGKYHWRYDFHLVSYAATCIFLYAWLLPLILWGALQWTSSSEDTNDELIEAPSAPGLLELLCLYGYSLAIYVPITFLWTIQLEWLRWILVAVAALLSGGVLLRSLLPVITGKQKTIYIAVILGMHLLLAAGFKLYFFHEPSRVPHHEDLTTAKNIIVTTIATKVAEIVNASKPTA